MVESDRGRAARSQVEVVIDGITAMLTSGELTAGARLPVENDLADRFGVSRGSLREAVRALAVLGVVETRQGAGTYVTSLEPEGMLRPLQLLAELELSGTSGQLLEIRRVLETDAAGAAATAIDEAGLDRLAEVLDGVDPLLEDDGDDLEAFIDADAEFHLTIVRAAGNPALTALVQSLVSRTARARLWRAVAERDAVAATQAEHRAILRELRRRDPERARIRMANHLLGVEQFARDHEQELSVVDPADDATR
jgi:GntR family transcriptional regulator, transcriptional repressor for pyruvate dehydrogenase complex